MINGNTQGVKRSVLERMDALYEIELERDMFATHELLGQLAEFTELTGREISIYISRDGQVLDVSIGEDDRVSMPSMALRRDDRRLSRIRCIHTHPGGDGRLSAVDLQTLRSSRFDAMAAIGVLDGEYRNMQVAMAALPGESADYTLIGPFGHHIPFTALMQEIEDRDAQLTRQLADTVAMATEQETAILIGMDREDGWGQESIEELGRLAETAGLHVLESHLQRGRKLDAATYLGKGKIEEISLRVSALKASMVICDEELTGAQTRNLEKMLGTKVIDRTLLILDIFAGRAQSREGKVQVELAQYKYRLPRLVGQGVGMSRTGGTAAGGGAARGVGETKLQIDRSVIRRRIYELEQELKEIRAQRDVRRVRRVRNQIPVVALVGYTNAGKSSLLNALSNSSVYVQDQLFATLDPITRRIELPNKTEVLLVDTVGFIRKLPHDLVDAFRSTLEEATHANLLLHVIDSSSQKRDGQMQVVDEVLESLKADEKPSIRVFNKIDRLPEGDMIPADASSVSTCCLTGEGMEALLLAIQTRLEKERQQVELLIPYAKGDILSWLHKHSTILETSYEEEGTRIAVCLEKDDHQRIARMLEA